MKYSLFISCLFLIILGEGCRENENELKITEYVNPFIGTSGHGHTFPGAVFPFGGIQLSPDNPRSNRDRCVGYHYSDSIISSFSHTHLSGSSTGNLQDIGFLPVTTQPDTFVSPSDYIQSNYASFKHTHEIAEPGYYSVIFDNGIKTELSATPRCGIHYYQYPPHTFHALTLDLTTARNGDQTTEINLRKINNRTLEGYRKSQRGTNSQRVYFVVEFSQDCQVLAGNEKFLPLENGQKYSGPKGYAWINFGENTNKIIAKISISSANVEGAMANLEKELSHWSFDKVKKDAKQAWKRELQKIRVESKNEEQLEIFYTALYHSYLAPALLSDINGNYKGPDGEVHSVNKHPQYTFFALEDAYRAVFPLFTLTQKKRAGDMILSLLKHYDIYGRLPVRELTDSETDSVPGNPSLSVISEAWRKGIRNFDGERAYEVLKKTALAREEKADKDKYSWQVGQNIEDLIALYGGPKMFGQKLDSLFSASSSSPQKGQIGCYDHTNTSLHHIAYLYNYIEQPYKTQFYVHQILNRLYNSTPAGLCGNDKGGQISAWYVFSAMGLYPVNPPDGKYQLGSPLFEKIILKTGPEKKFIIRAPQKTAQEIYVKEVYLNKQKLNRMWITHEELVNGGELEFILTSQPSL